jgi:prepilin-type N-terminal cleavage/methylation domain-containing protein
MISVRKAFTLLELMVAFIIMAILAAVAVPSLSQITAGAATTAAVVSVANVGNDARDTAVSKSEPVPTSIDIASAVADTTGFTGQVSATGNLHPSTGYRNVSYAVSGSGAGLAMQSTSGGCALALITTEGVQTWSYPSLAPSGCDGTVAINGSTQPTPTSSTTTSSTTTTVVLAGITQSLDAVNAGGNAQSLAISCTDASNCTIGGQLTDSSGNLQAFVADEINGTWQALQVVAGGLNLGNNALVFSVSCTSPRNCLAGGQYKASAAPSYLSARPFVVQETNGTWGTARTISTPGSGMLRTVSCTSPGNCAIGGQYNQFGGFAFVADEVNGTWNPIHEVAASLNVGGFGSVIAISCTSVGNCAAGGNYNDSNFASQAFVVTEINGLWGSPTEVGGNLNVGGGAAIGGVSCWSDGNCTATGYYLDASFTPQSIVLDETNDAWGLLSGTVPSGRNIAMNLGQPVSCTSADTCVFLGAGYSQETNGTWGAEQPAATSLGGGSVIAVSCPTTSFCAAVGNAYNGDPSGPLWGSQVFFSTKVNGTWGN